MSSSPAAQSPSPAWRKQAEQALRDAARELSAGGQDVVAKEIRQLLEHVMDPGPLRVVLAGERGQGKSTLANALAGCPDLVVTRSGAATERRVEIHGGGPGARVHFLAGGTLEVGPAAVADWAAGRVGPLGDEPRPVSHIEVAAPGVLLHDVVVVDTPGSPDGGEALANPGLQGARGADVLLLVTDCHRGLTASEMDLLKLARERVAILAVVVTKVDGIASWRVVVGEDREKLAAHGFADVPLFAVSAALAEDSYDAARGTEAERLADRADAGVGVLESFLGDQVKRREELRTSNALAAARTELWRQRVLRESSIAAFDNTSKGVAEYEVRKQAEALKAVVSQIGPRVAEHVRDLRRALEDKLRDDTRALLFELDESTKKSGANNLRRLVAETSERISALAMELAAQAGDSLGELERALLSEIDREAAGGRDPPGLLLLADEVQVPLPEIRGLDPLMATGGIGIAHMASGTVLATLGIAGGPIGIALGLAVGAAVGGMFGRARSEEQSRRQVSQWLRAESSKAEQAMSRELGRALESSRDAIVKELQGHARRRAEEIVAVIEAQERTHIAGEDERTQEISRARSAVGRLDVGIAGLDRAIDVIIQTGR